jgi:hypothetical protein
MSKSNDTSKLDHAKLENRVLADSELDAVTGGRISTIHPAAVTVPDIKLTMSAFDVSDLLHSHPR